MRLSRLLQPALSPFAKRFVAGETTEQTLNHVASLNDDGITAMIDLLGEHVERKPVAENALTRYVKLLDRIEERDVAAALSIKLTHLGIAIGHDYCRSNVHHLVEHAAGHDTFLWIDMESTDHTDDTLDMYTDVRDVHDNVGVTVQSYLKRSPDDLQHVLDHGGIVRLVKGTYDEPADIAYRDREKVRDQYRQMMEQLFAQDNYFAVATHDTELIDYTQKLAEEYGKDQDRFEFQFLMGVRDDLERELAADGYNVSEYVPYGPNWLPYYWRRVQEQKDHVELVAKKTTASLVGR